MADLSLEKEQNDTLWDKVGIPARGAELHLAIENGLPYDVFVKMAEATQIAKKELSACLSITQSTLNRRAEKGRFTIDESDKLYRFTNTLVIATSLFEGDQKDAIAWLRSNVKGLGNRKPIQMLSSSAGCDVVLDIIGQLEHGVFA